MKNLTVAATQFFISDSQVDNIDKAASFIKDAVKKGANIVLLPELFSSPYFCKTMNTQYFNLAQPVKDHPMLSRMSELAKECEVVLPISFFEKSENGYYNSLMMIDANGTQLGVYRKSHIPEGPGYEEKFYFQKGDTGFKVWETRYANVGCGICWDQWFPEMARDMVLQGADVLLYPTAIGSEPPRPQYDSSGHWQRVMLGHAAANMVPVVASNRVGLETDGDTSVTFYGSSFITDGFGEIKACADRSSETILCHTLNLDEIKKERENWGLFRDRRVDLYSETV